MHQHPRRPQPVDDGCSHIAHADRTARRDDQQIGLSQGFDRLLIERLGVIGYNPLWQRDGPLRRHQRPNRGAVEIAHLVQPRHGFRWDQLIAGGDQRHARTPHHRHARDSQCRESSQLLRPQQPPGGDHQVAGLHVLADRDHPLTGRDRPQHLHLARSRLLRPLDHHHRIRSRRQHPARVHHHGLPRPDQHGWRAAHRHLAHHPQISRQ